jgi:hypothetical protein
MASEIKANKISPATGTALTIGDLGDTLSITGTVSTTGNSTNTGNLDVTGDLTTTGNLTTTGDLTVDTNTLYVDSTNNKVGVGTSSPSEFLEVGNETASNNYIQVSAANNTQSGIKFRSDSSKTTGWDIGYEGNGNYLFFKNDVGGTVTERMRIDSTGKVGINTVASSGMRLRVLESAANTYCSYLTGNDYNIYSGLSATAGFQMVFSTTNFTVGSGSIYSTGSTTSYNTSSDYRLKENVQPLTDGINKLKQLKPSHWTWTQDGQYGEGFIAHEAQQVVPISVTGTKDAMRLEGYEITPAVINDEGVETAAAVMGTREVPEYQGMDTSKLVPLLTAALQEAIAKIESLETRVSALETN